MRNPPKCDDVEDQGKQFKPLTKPPYKPPTEPPQPRSFQANQREVKRRPRVYYDQPNHSSTNCDNVTSVSEISKYSCKQQTKKSKFMMWWLKTSDLRRELPVYLILGTSECAKIKTETVPKMGKPGEPIAELTRLGWTLVSWERTTPNQDVSDPDIQSWLWRALLARFMCLDYSTVPMSTKT